MIAIIDNYDSFTYNVWQQVESLGKRAKVYAHDKVPKDLNPTHIIISPGPKRPEHSGDSMKIIKKFYRKIPILGICLGHECIGQLFGSTVKHADKIMHGKTSQVYHTEDRLFRGLKNSFQAARYHSLILDKVPEDFELTAWTKDNEIMAIHHKKHPLYGIQFHPESFLTEEGEKLMHNFLYES